MQAHVFGVRLRLQETPPEPKLLPPMLSSSPGASSTVASSMRVQQQQQQQLSGMASPLPTPAGKLSSPSSNPMIRSPSNNSSSGALVRSTSGSSLSAFARHFTRYSVDHALPRGGGGEIFVAAEETAHVKYVQRARLSVHRTQVDNLLGGCDLPIAMQLHPINNDKPASASVAAATGAETVKITWPSASFFAGSHFSSLLKYL